MKTSKDYNAEIAGLSSSTDFSALDVLVNTLSANFSYRNVLLGQLEANRALFIGNMQEEHDKISIAKCIAAWDYTDGGVELIKTKREVESIKQLIKAVENQSFSLRAEARLTANS